MTIFYNKMTIFYNKMTIFYNKMTILCNFYSVSELLDVKALIILKN